MGAGEGRHGSLGPRGANRKAFLNRQADPGGLVETVRYFLISKLAVEDLYFQGHRRRKFRQPLGNVT